MMDIYIDGKKIALDCTNAMGGGEANIFPGLSGVTGFSGKVAKIFKQPDHPDLAGMVDLQSAAVSRIAEHQTKLRDFPNMPGNVVSPEKLITNKKGYIIGYVMRFLSNTELLVRYTENDTFRQLIPNNKIVDLFKNIRNTVKSIHEANVQIGDFSDLNVLVSDESGGLTNYFIDADSFQYGKYLGRTFTPRFVDPLLCDQSLQYPSLIGIYHNDSDWFIYTRMLFNALMLTDVYGGVHRPKDRKQLVRQDARSLRRITVFNQDVIYPHNAVHYSVLPDELLQYFHQVFEKDIRGEFPEKLIDSIKWTKCNDCNIEHARQTCPKCGTVNPDFKTTIRVNGNVSSERIFKTSGYILYSTVQNGNLMYVYNEDNTYKRESKKVVLNGPPMQNLKIRVSGDKTMIGMKDSLITIDPISGMSKIVVDDVDGSSCFDANGKNTYWINDGQLLKQSVFGSEHVGDVLPQHTKFWIGTAFGFGFYKTWNYTVCFVFDTASKCLNDNVKIKMTAGQLLDSICYFSDDLAWFLTETSVRGIMQHCCNVIDKSGRVIATFSGEKNDGTWLGDLRGKVAVGSMLFSTTPDGIVRLDLDMSTGSLQTRLYDNSEPFVNTSCNMHLIAQHLYVVDVHEIRKLTIQ